MSTTATEIQLRISQAQCGVDRTLRAWGAAETRRLQMVVWWRCHLYYEALTRPLRLEYRE